MKWGSALLFENLIERESKKFRFGINSFSFSLSHSISNYDIAN